MLVLIGAMTALDYSLAGRMEKSRAIPKIILRRIPGPPQQRPNVLPLPPVSVSGPSPPSSQSSPAPPVSVLYPVAKAASMSSAALENDAPPSNSSVAVFVNGS